MKLSRALSDLVKYTKSVGTHDVEMEGEGRVEGGARQVGRGGAGCVCSRLAGLCPSGL